MNKEERLKNIKDWELYYYNLYQKNYDNEVLRGKYYEKWQRYKVKTREFIDTRGYSRETVLIKANDMTPDQKKAIETFLKQEVSGDNSKRRAPMPIFDTGMLRKSIMPKFPVVLDKDSSAKKFLEKHKKFKKDSKNKDFKVG